MKKKFPEIIFWCCTILVVAGITVAAFFQPQIMQKLSNNDILTPEQYASLVMLETIRTQ